MANELTQRAVRQVYLVTYSQADTESFPTRKSFAEAVCEAFTSTTNATILHWVCSSENHQNGGTHYHMALKLNRCQRWLPVRQYIQSEFGINVHFSNRHINYYTAWTYATKDDETPLQSENHPILLGPPRTAAASQVHSQQHSQDPAEPPTKRRRSRLTNFEVGNLIREQRLKSRTELLAFADMQQQEGKSDLSEFIFNRGKKGSQ
jgi:hypothetical protein